MRASARAGAALGLVAAIAGVSVGATIGPASADPTAPVADKTAWYWSLVGASVQGQSLPADAPTAASLVPDGSLGVGYLADQEDTALGTDRSDRVAAVAFDLGATPRGALFRTFRVSMPLDPAGHQVTSGTPDVSACELTAGFTDSAAPQSAQAIPPYSPASCVNGEFRADLGSAGGYVFDLTAMANDWSGGTPAEGVLIRPTTGLATPQAPFALSFLGKAGIVTAADATLPEAPVDQGPMPPAPAAQPPAPGLAPAPAPVLAPPVTQVAPQPAPAVLAPVPQANPAPAAPPMAAVAYHQGALVPGGRWWLGFLGLLALLGMTSVVLGDPLVPVPVDARRRRFEEVVRTQSTSRGRTPPGTARVRPA